MIVAALLEAEAVPGASFMDQLELLPEVAVPVAIVWLEDTVLMRSVLPKVLGVPE